MKKILFVAMLAVVSVMAYAQPRAIGGRLGYGAEFSYQHALGTSNMVQLEVGVPFFSYLEAACTYDWIDPFNAPVPWDKRGEWHWYMGVGGSGGFVFPTGEIPGTWYAGVAGHIGIEYDFWFPFQLSLDWRPSIGVAGNNGIGFNIPGLWGGLQLGVRYKF